MWWRLAKYNVKTSDMKGNCYVCVIVDDSCCNYVPDNYADGHLIDQDQDLIDIKTSPKQLSR